MKRHSHLPPGPADRSLALAILAELSAVDLASVRGGNSSEAEGGSDPGGQALSGGCGPSCCQAWPPPSQN